MYMHACLLVIRDCDLAQVRPYCHKLENMLCLDFEFAKAIDIERKETPCTHKNRTIICSTC